MPELGDMHDEAWKNKCRQSNCWPEDLFLEKSSTGVLHTMIE